MHRKIAIGIIMVFVIAGLSGCTEITGIKNGQVTGQDKVELLSYNIDSWTWMDEKICDGFNHNEPVNYYKIRGTIKNKMDHDANIQIMFKFYDENNKYLGSEELGINNMPASKSYSFEENINKHVARFSNYWDQIEKVTFDFSEI